MIPCKSSSLSYAHFSVSNTRLCNIAPIRNSLWPAKSSKRRVSSAVISLPAEEAAFRAPPIPVNWRPEDEDLNVRPAQAPAALQFLLSEYDAVLHQYRLLKQRVQPWEESFMKDHGGRRPTTQDAREHGGEDFAASFREACDLKRRLYFEAPLLRRKIDEATAEASGSTRHKRDKHRGAPGSSARSCNETSAKSPDAIAAQWSQARDYKRRQERSHAKSLKREEPQQLLQPLVGSSAGTDSGASTSTQPPTFVTPSTSTPVPNAPSATATSTSAIDLPPSQAPNALPAVGGSGNERIKMAAAAAAAYRSKKQQQAQPGASTSGAIAPQPMAFGLDGKPLGEQEQVQQASQPQRAVQAATAQAQGQHGKLVERAKFVVKSGRSLEAITEHAV